MLCFRSHSSNPAIHVIRKANIIILLLSAHRYFFRSAAATTQKPTIDTLSGVISTPKAFLSTLNQGHLSNSNQTNIGNSFAIANLQSRELSLSSSKEFPWDNTDHINRKAMFKYPKVERDESQVEEQFGVKVEDPYRFLEDTDSNVTKEFVKAQNELVEPYLQQCPHRSRIKDILTASQDYERFGCPFKRGSKYYFFMNSGLQQQAVLYQQDSLNSEPRVFFDPNSLSHDGTVALSQISFSPDGKYFAYSLSHSGSDWVEINIKIVDSGENFSEKLERIKFSSIEWTHDNKGFFYTQFPNYEGATKGTEDSVNENQAIYYHTIGTPQSEDILKVNFPDHPKWLLGFEVSHDGRFFHVFPREGCSESSWYYCDLNDFSHQEKLVLKPIHETFDAEFDYITNNQETVYFKTNLDAKNFRVVKLDLKKPTKENWVDLIPNHPSDVLDRAEAFSIGGQDYLLVNYLRKVVHYLELHKLEGGLVKRFPTTPGTIFKTTGRRNDGEIFFQLTSFLSPGKTFHFDLNNIDGDARVIRESSPKGFSADDYTIEQVFYKSKDQTEVPMFIIHRKDMVKDGKNPCLLYGYGGFRIQLTPSFNINRITWLKNFRGILAIANIRGGGELGRDWHESGRLLKKQNCFDDFIAAAEYLIDEKYTNRERIAIEGGSNGGLLVAAVSNQRPDLFGATVCHMGVLDMMRYSMFTIGYVWMSEFGDPKDKDQFQNLFKYSPYHNIPSGAPRYPSTLLLTADHDDRVVPAHSLKFIANLQHHLGSKLSDTPLLIRIDTKAGHGAGRPTSKTIDEYTDIYSFLYNALNLKDYFIDE